MAEYEMVPSLDDGAIFFKSGNIATEGTDNRQ